MTHSLSVSVDPQTHFPLVDVPGQGFALFWLPITKVQIEYFLCDTIDSQFDRAWYRERSPNNDRISAERLTAQNLSQAFITRITFHEARVFSRWYGGNFDLPTATEWSGAQQVFDQVPADPAFVEQVLALPDIHPRARLLVEYCEKALLVYQRLREPSSRRLSHQLLLRSGILEYVYQDSTYSLCGACGSTHSSGEHGSAGQDTFTRLRHEDIGDRSPNLGFRPILRKQR